MRRSRYFTKIIDTFYIRFGDVTDRSNTTCYMGLLTGDSNGVYHYSILINNPDTMEEIQERYLEKKNCKILNIRGHLSRKYASGKCVIQDVNVVEDITDRCFGLSGKNIEFETDGGIESESRDTQRRYR